MSVLLKPSPTVCDRVIDVHCCAATRIHQHVCGGGRHLAALPADLPHELPQVGTSRTTWKTILNQYNNNNTLVGHDRLRRHHNNAKVPEDPEMAKNFDMPEPSYSRYLQCQKTKDEYYTAGLIMLRNRFTEAERTYFSNYWGETQIIKTESAYFNVSQNLKLKELKLSKRDQLMRKKTTTEMIAVTQAGSERLLTKLIREFIPGEELWRE